MRETGLRRGYWRQLLVQTMMEEHQMWAEDRFVGVELCMQVLRWKRMLILLGSVGGQCGS